MDKAKFDELVRKGFITDMTIRPEDVEDGTDLQDLNKAIKDGFITDLTVAKGLIDNLTPADKSKEPAATTTATAMTMNVFEEPAPVVEETKVEEPAPVVEETKVEEPAPVVDETKVEEPAPVVEETKVEEPAPMVEKPTSKKSTSKSSKK